MSGTSTVLWLTSEQREVIEEIYFRLDNWRQGYRPMNLQKVSRRWCRKLETSGLINSSEIEESGEVFKP
jgi:hypothetical protein